MSQNSKRVAYVPILFMYIFKYVFYIVCTYGDMKIKYWIDNIQTTCTSSDHDKNTCKVSKRSA